jgi:hypothetical protein
MPELSRVQAIMLATLATIGLLYLAILVAGPVLEYLHGPSPETTLLHKLADIGPAALIFIGLMIALLQRMGILPAAKINAGSESPAGGMRLRNLVIWIVIALLLVFMFNFFQGNGHANSAPSVSPPLMGVFVNWFPMLLIVGVWFYFVRKIRVNKNRNPPSDP